MTGEKGRRGRPKVKSDEQRVAEIARQARDLFIANGYAEVTMDDIAASCRVSKRTLYSLFKNKADVFATIIDQHRQTMLALPGDYGHLPIADALWTIFRADLTYEENHERLAIIRLVRMESERFPELETMLHERGGEYSRKLLAQWLDEQKQAGRIVMDDPWHAAKMLMDMIFGAIVVKGRHDLRWTSDEERWAYFRQCIAIFTNGILPAQSPERFRSDPA